MEKLKKYSNYLIISLIVLLLCGSVKSCSKERKIKRLENNIEMVEHQKDSVISVLNDSIKDLNKQIQILDVKNKGFEQSIMMQQEAMNQISAAKKNIHVTVKNDKK